MNGYKNTAMLDVAVFFLYKENPRLCLGFEKAYSYEYK